jgi:hypothetical protein
VEDAKQTAAIRGLRVEHTRPKRIGVSHALLSRVLCRIEPKENQLSPQQIPKVRRSIARVRPQQGCHLLKDTLYVE